VKIADLATMGFLPLQDHAAERAHNLAKVIYGVRMDKPDREGRYMPQRETAGDLVGAVLAQATQDRKLLGSWSFAMPVVGQAPIPTAGDIANGPVANVKPIKDFTPSGVPQPYAAFKDLSALGTTGAMRALPRNYPGIVISALEESKQLPIIFPNGPLVAVNKAGEPACGSLVTDLKDDSSVDPERQARLQSLVRVARVQDPVLPGGPNGGVLALQYGVSGKDQIAGYGLIAMPPFGGTPVPANAVNVGTQPRPGNPGTATRDGLAVLFGPMSAARGGPITLGDASCQHVIGATLDGERVQPAHLATDAVFWQGPTREGPLTFDRGNYSNPSPGPRLIPAHIRLDPSAPYTLPTGPNGAPRQHLGMWRIEAESWVEEQKDGPPPTGDAFPPPPTTVVRTPGGASGPGDNGDPQVFRPDGGGQNVTKGKGFQGGVRGGQPPPVAGGGVRGPGGGNPEPDSPWTVGPWGYTNPAWPLGIDTSLYRPFPDPYAPIGPYDFGFGYGDGFIATAGTAGRYLNVQNNAFRPYDYAAIPPVLANPYPGVSKASFPNPISTTGIAVKAFPTNSLAQDTRRTPTNDPFLEARRPQTANLEGYAYGNGFDGGWTYTNPPGTRTPTGKGGLVMLPGDLTLQQYRTGSYPTQPATTFVAVKDHVGIGWGVPLANGGVQGVRAVADSAGLSFRPTDSSGVEIAGVGLRIGEGGVIVTGKLTVTGRLDPTTLELTNQVTDDIPLGKVGFRFDSTTYDGPLWKKVDGTTIQIGTGGGGGAGGLIAIGSIVSGSSATPPSGFLLCDGSAVSRATYADLNSYYSALGYPHGSGDGSTTFNLPNLKGRSLMGVDAAGSGEVPTAAGQAKGEATHALTAGEGPVHNHSMTTAFQSAGGGAINCFTAASFSNVASAVTTNGVVTTAGNAGSGTAHNTIHPVLGVYFYVCYETSSSGPSASSFADNLFNVYDNGDSTKKAVFQLSGVSAATTRTLTVPNASGTLALTANGSLLTSVEVDLGSTARRSGQFTITDAAISGTTKIIVLQAGGPYTGKGTLGDEAEMDALVCAATPGSGSATVYWNSATRVKGNVKFHYVVGV